MDTVFDSRRALFKFHRAEIAQGRMAPPPVIESFDVCKNGRLCLLPALKLSTINQLGFQARKEALPDGIVPTIPRSTHGTLQAVPCEPLLVLSRRILLFTPFLIRL